MNDSQLALLQPKARKALHTSRLDDGIYQGPDAEIYLGDCRHLLKNLSENYVDLVVTDPPYFIDGMGADWNDQKIRERASRSGVIGGLPVGMKFDRKQGEALQAFMTPIAAELYRVLKPGGFCIVFSQARLYHRMAMSLDLAGFEIRDMLAWKYEGQAKAFSQSHFIMKDRNLQPAEKRRLISELDGYKTPQLKPQMEPMVMAQKPKDGTFVQNWLKYKLGLVNTKESLDGRFPGNVMEVSKHAKESFGGKRIDHATVKPVALVSHLVNLFTQKGQMVLDPFLGSGTHAVAAVLNKRKFTGIERERKYFELSIERLENIFTE